jgi:hypothetical protein
MANIIFMETCLFVTLQLKPPISSMKLIVVILLVGIQQPILAQYGLTELTIKGDSDFATTADKRFVFVRRKRI